MKPRDVCAQESRREETSEGARKTGTETEEDTDAEGELVTL